MNCKIFLWCLHTVISNIKPQSWYEILTLISIVTLYWCHWCDNMLSLIWFAWDEYLRFRLQCYITMRNPFSQKQSTIYFFVIKHRHLKHKGASVAELLKLVIFEHKSNTTYFLEVTIITIKATLTLKHSTVLVRKDINVYEYKKLSNFTLRHKVEKDCFYCCSTFHSHSRVFNHEQNSHSKMSVKTVLF